MKSRAPWILCLIVLGLLILGAGGPGLWGRAPASVVAAAPLPEGQEDLPPGVSIQTALDSMHHPVAMAFDPQGRLFYTEKDTGNVRLFANGALQSAPVITFPVTAVGERGLLGIAIDPAFAQNHYIYVYYT